MNYLAIDTSGKHLTVVCVKDGVPFEYYSPDCATKHSNTLMEKVEEVLNFAELKGKDLDFIACVVGAGSFTGIRIGIATVKALCFAYGKPYLSITSFDTLAYNEKDGKVLAVIDAKHDGFYVAGYTDGKVDYPPKYILKDELLSLLDGYKAVSIDKIDKIDTKTVSVLNGLKNAIEVKRDCVSFEYSELKPLYCRKSQAEEGR